MIWRTALAVACLAGSLIYVLLGSYGSLLSQAVLAGLVLLLLPSLWRYMRRVEGRGALGLAGQGLAIWGLTWLVEKLILGRTISGWSYAYDSAQALSWGPGGIPILIPTVWLVFGWIEDAVISGMEEKGTEETVFRRGWGLLSGCLAGGWILLAIDAAFEWHFSRAAAFWKWEQTPGASASIAGVPVWNFGLWFLVGTLVALSSRLGGRHARPDPTAIPAGLTWLRKVPAAGLGFLLLAGTGMNFAYGVPEGAWACVISFVALLFALGIRARKDRLSKARPQGPDRAENRSVRESLG